ncbi:MAG: HlyD family efflux transporter periplasmic adaptor subunit [Prevotella sp.]|nr:HlyD family efflux transporter periplasmic adaptor subunit [Prevotella sp.]
MKTKNMALLSMALIVAACMENQERTTATGTFEATEIIVSAEGNGNLLQFDVAEGQELKEGEQVGLIDTVQLQLTARQLGATRNTYASQRPDAQKQIAVIREELSTAIKERDRFKRLVDENAANKKLLDDATSQVKVLERQLEAQQSNLGNTSASLNSQMSTTDIQRYKVLDQLDKCHIKAPISGTVLEKYTERGEFTAVGKPLFKIADIENMFLRAYLTSSQLYDVKLGQKVTVVSDFGNNKIREYEGKVVWISSSAEFTPKTVVTGSERADQVYAVKIAVKNDGYIKIGMYGEVKLQKGQGQQQEEEQQEQQ